VTQPTLFDVRPLPELPGQEPPHVEAVTSCEAAAAIAPVAGNLRRLVLEFIAGQGDQGATDHEVAAGLGMLSDTARARRCELVDAGYLVASGQRRRTPSGRSATVWVARDVEAIGK